jgi:hypothetical protein
MQSLAEEIVRGDMALPANCFSFDQVHLNLPGDPAYNPCIAKVRKFNSTSGLTAGDMATYVDDIWTIGASFDLCWAVCHRLGLHGCVSWASRMHYGNGWRQVSKRGPGRVP